MNYINSVTINGGNRTIGLGTKVYLTATILPSNATYPVVHWCSSNPSVVEVDKYTGCVYANSMGSVVITAQAQDGSYKQGTCIVTACAIPVESVSVLPTTLKLKVGEKAPLEAVVSPSNATNKTVRWYSNSGSDMPVVDVNATTGCVYAKSLGVAKVFAVSKDGTNKTDSCDVEVVETLPQWVTITPYGGSIYKGGEMDLSASVYPADTTYKQVRWSTEDNNIIELDPNTGHIVAKAVGTATVKAYVMVTPSLFTTCKIEVTPYVPVMDIQLCPDKMAMFVGQTTTLDPLIYPSDASEQSVKWSSWDSNIVSVDQSGVITAKKGGTTTITVEGEKGKKASVEVNVYIDTVTIEPDGEHKLNTKVVFNSTGKVWYCINRDMIYDERYMSDISLHRRCNRNVFVDPDKGNALKEFTDDEIKLLYAIDPCGVARYVQDYASIKYMYDDFSKVFEYKDYIFELLFNKKPRYFKQNYNGEWEVTVDKSDLYDVISESESYFGMHPTTNGLRIAISAIDFAFGVISLACKNPFWDDVISALNCGFKIAILVLNDENAAACQEFISYFKGLIDLDESLSENLDDKAGKNIYVFEIISVCKSLAALLGELQPNKGFHCAIMDYSIQKSNYIIKVELSNGDFCKLSDIKRSLEQAQ